MMRLLPDYAVFRHDDNQKWFAIVMDVNPDKLGLSGSEPVDIIDVKIDDGRPGTGILIGLKNGYVKSVDNEDGKKRICYNTLQNDVSNGYYVSSTETKNGCNILYIIR